MNASKRVVLLIDADNVSADVVDQAVAKVMADHGAIHVRRAYCTAESALANLKLFKSHSIRPIVNLSTGKNSTDIALAVDAVDLVVAERPDVVVIVSSDSDFAPLVIKLREKGCRVEGIGQLGKTGDDSKPVYDAFTDIAHRKAGRVVAPAPAPEPARKRARSGAQRRGEALAQGRPEVPPAPRTAAAAEPAAAGSAPLREPVPSAPATSDEAPPAPARPLRSRGRRPPKATLPAAATDAAEAATDAAATPAPTSAPAPTPTTTTPTTPTTTTAAPTPPAHPRAAMPDALRRILAVLPELARGGTLDLGVAAERLRSEDLLARHASSTRLFRQHPEWFVLTPQRQPNKVQYRGLGGG